MIDRPRGRDLDAGELESLARRVGERPDLWRDLVRHDPRQRTYELLFGDQHVMAWLICWMDDHDTGFHDHDLSAGAVAVVAGRVREERLRLGAPPLSRTFRPHATFSFEASEIHRVVHAGGGPAVTVHAYSPPLRRLGAYLVEPGGALRRESISYAEELRPLEAAR
jgi:hypothetical protein